MALTGSGQLSFNDVRIETSQSITNNYSFFGWAAGEYNYFNGSAQNYAPINLLSTGSEFCRSYSLYLSCGGPASADYNYLDCGGAPVSTSFNCGTTVYFNAKNGSVNHAPPVTVLTDLGPALRFSESSPLNTPLSMSAWYSYDHTTYIGLDETASLYHHSIYNCYPSSMIVIDAGTTDTSLVINISGSATDAYGYGCWVLFYGKPWTSNATNGSVIPGCGCNNAGTAIVIDSGSATLDVNKAITYDYVYNSATGSKLYLVLYGDFCFSP
jgi:hypothetical protein